MVPSIGNRSDSLLTLMKELVLPGKYREIFQWLTIAWVLSMILTPIGIWTLGQSAFPLLTSLTVLLQVALSVIALLEMVPAYGGIGRIAIIVVGTIMLEALGASSGFPFGEYHYTAALQPQIFGVPLLIPFAWAMMILPAWSVAGTILRRGKAGIVYQLAFSAVAALAFTAWDFYLDPHMVARGLWVWGEVGGYFGIPWSNYLGWFGSAMLLTWIARPWRLKSPKLILIYALTWIFQGVAQFFFWSQPGPALVGFTLMGLFAVLAGRSLWQEHYPISGS